MITKILLLPWQNMNYSYQEWQRIIFPIKSYEISGKYCPIVGVFLNRVNLFLYSYRIHNLPCVERSFYALSENRAMKYLDKQLILSENYELISNQRAEKLKLLV